MPMSTTLTVTPVSTVSPSTFGGGGAFSAFMSGSLLKQKWGLLRARVEPGGFGAFASTKMLQDEPC